MPFEVQSLKNGTWTIVSTHDDNNSAISDAQMLLNSKYTVAIRVIEEIYDEASDQYRSKVIFKREKEDKVIGAPSKRPSGGRSAKPSADGPASARGKKAAKKAMDPAKKSKRKKKKKKTDLVKWTNRVLFLLLALAGGTMAYYRQVTAPPEEETAGVSETEFSDDDLYGGIDDPDEMKKSGRNGGAALGLNGPQTAEEKASGTGRLAARAGSSTADGRVGGGAAPDQSENSSAGGDGSGSPASRAGSAGSAGDFGTADDGPGGSGENETGASTATPYGGFEADLNALEGQGGDETGAAGATGIDSEQLAGLSGGAGALNAAFGKTSWESVKKTAATLKGIPPADKGLAQYDEISFYTLDPFRLKWAENRQVALDATLQVALDVSGGKSRARKVMLAERSLHDAMYIRLSDLVTDYGTRQDIFEPEKMGVELMAICEEVLGPRVVKDIIIQTSWRKR